MDGRRSLVKEKLYRNLKIKSENTHYHDSQLSGAYIGQCGAEEWINLW